MTIAGDRKFKKIAVLSLTRGGRRLAGEIAEHLSEAYILGNQAGVAGTIRDNWQKFDAFVCIMAAGIVVRAIAPLLVDKEDDPAVVVLDEKGRFAVSLLSGHLGGANDLARRLTVITGGQAVITTSSDTLGHTPLDLWARENGLVWTDRKKMTAMSCRLVDNGSLSFYLDDGISDLPHDFHVQERPEDADVIVSWRLDFPADKFVLHPRNLVAGVGCNRGTRSAQIEKALQEACRENGLALEGIRNLASIDLKQDEEGLLEFARDKNCWIDFFSKDDLNGVKDVSSSEAVMKATGARGVAEPAALLSAGSTKLIVRKMKWKDVTIAIARVDWPWSVPDREVRNI